MDETLVDWIDGIPVLLAAARSGSATAAGEHLNVSTATALRRIQRLEDALGVQLFERTPTGLQPTAALARAVPWAEQIEAAAHGLIRELHGLETEAKGTVRLALMSGLSNWFIAPGAQRLRARHPDIVLELVPASAVVDLEQRQADLALRMVRPESRDLVVHELAEVSLVVVAAPRLLEQVRPKALSDIPWVDWDRSLGEISESRWLATQVPNARVVLRSNELVTLVRAAQAGVGAILLATQLAAMAGGLVPVEVPTPPMPSLPLCLVAHRALRPVPRIAAVWDWVLDEFAAIATAGAATAPLGATGQ